MGTPRKKRKMATREHKVSAVHRGPGALRRVNFGRNDTKYIMRHREYYRLVQEATRRMDQGKGIRLSLEEVRARLGLEG